MAHGRVSVPDDLLNFLREVLVAQRQRSLYLIDAIDEPANQAYWRERMDAAPVGADDF